MTGIVEQRAATAEDVPWLASVFIGSLQAAITGARGFWDPEMERHQFLRQLRLSDTSVLIENDWPVGFYTAWLEPDHLCLGTLCVAPAQQNRGIGTVAMRAIAARSKDRPVRFSVLKSNVAARRFYERLGCRLESSGERHDHLVWLPDDR